MFVMRDSKAFYFHFDFKREIEFIITSNEPLAKIIIKTILTHYC